MAKPIPQQGDGLARLQAVVHDLRSPDGCPWDLEQSHQSLLPNLLEEAYEAVEALRLEDRDHIVEELGDLLLQVVMHAEIGSETGAFDLQQIAHAISGKLIRRHPHVYGSSDAGTSAAVLTQWEAIKQAEQGGGARPLLQGVARGLPSLSRAAKLSKKAAGVGFDWPDSIGVIDKIREELAEVDREPLGSPARADEIGDLLFSVANLARKEGLDPEVLCAAANEKFAARFTAMERALDAASQKLGEVDLATMEAAWQSVK